jgi:hypothetical protein
MLQPGNKGGVPETSGVAQCGEEIPHHGAIHGAILGFGGLTHPRRDEDMGRVDPGQGRPQRFGFDQVGRDRAYPIDADLRLAGQAINFPTLGDQVRGEIVADDAGHAGDECPQCHEFSPCSQDA